jgi:hypothetical protein
LAQAQFFELKEGDALSVLQNQGQQFCAKTWAEAKEEYPAVKESRLANYCFSSM